MKRILFIGHEASRSGAPLILLHFLQWLKANDARFDADLLLLHGGDLEEEYRKVANVFVLPKSETPHLIKRGVSFLKRKLTSASKYPNLPPFSRNYDVVLGNTIISLEYLKFFKDKNFPTVCWLHELDFAVGLYGKEKFISLTNYIDGFLVVSQAVEAMLKRFRVAGKTHLVYGFPKISFEPPGANEIEAVKKELGVPTDAFIVGCGGTIEWRKGADLFLQIAGRLSKREDLYFIWVGGASPHSNAEYERIQFDFERMETRRKVIFTGSQKSPHKFFAAMDLFVLTSREDPFPLVCLEAAALGVPTICFEQAGGMTEFVGSDAGAVVPYGDIEAFCEKIIYFYENRDALKRAGQAAREKTNAKFSMGKSCAAIREVLRETAKL